MKGLGLNCMLVGKLNKLKIGFAKYWLFSLKTQPTNKQSKHITATGFINLQLLQKLSSQKLFWDKARLSSLVNKRFVGYHILYEFIEIMNIYFSYIDFWAVSTNLEGLWLLSSGIFCDLGVAIPARSRPHKTNFARVVAKLCSFGDQYWSPLVGTLIRKVGRKQWMGPRLSVNWL